jgi:uncharacterized protein (TIGR01777 family)
LKVLVSGSTGLIGSALLPHLSGSGDEVLRLVRRIPCPGKAQIYWNPVAGRLEPAELEGLDAVVHLAGENISGGRWTPEKKARIRDSRVRGTRLLAEAISRLAHPPAVFVSASAIGYYGSRGEEILGEESQPGSGFMAELCQAWEAATAAAAQEGVRVVNLRMAPVLTPRGGILRRLLMPFRLGLGGKIGNGRQYMSWITMDDLVCVILRVLRSDSLRGPINVASPKPVTNLEFTRTLGRVLRRPTFLTVPPAGLRLLFGEMADELLLSSTRVEPARLKARGYRFRHSDLESALRHLLGTSSG